MDKIFDRWNRRSVALGDSLQSVLYASFSDSINALFHQWEVDVLTKYFPKNKKKINVLDVGCGYGRLSWELSKRFPSAYFYGVDFAKEYIKFYNKKLGKKGVGEVSDIRSISFKNSFDVIIIVTVLMYLSEEDICTFIEKLEKKLQSGAIIIVIENSSSGENFLSLHGLIRMLGRYNGNRNQHGIQSKIFKKNEVRDYFNAFTLIKKETCSFLTLILPFLLLFDLIGITTAKRIPRFLNILPSPSLYEAYIFQK